MITSHNAGAQTMVRRKASKIARMASPMTTGVMKGRTNITATSAVKTSDKTNARIRTGDRRIVDSADILLDILKTCRCWPHLTSSYFAGVWPLSKISLIDKHSKYRQSEHGLPSSWVAFRLDDFRDWPFALPIVRQTIAHANCRRWCNLGEHPNHR